MTLLEFIRSAAMDFVAVFFAYCVTAHFVGKQMNGSIAVGVTAVYTLFLLNPFLALIGVTDSYLDIVSSAIGLYPDSAFFETVPNDAFLRLVVLAAPLLGWMASVFYMHGWIRKDEQLEDAK
jgi:hypothetical protein